MSSPSNSPRLGLQALVVASSFRAKRPTPTLSTLKVLAVLRKAHLPISRWNARGGTAEGMKVAYGDSDRTFVKVSCAFPWNFEFMRGFTKGSSQHLLREVILDDLFNTAQQSLLAAGLQVLAHDDSNPHLAYLEVRRAQ